MEAETKHFVECIAFGRVPVVTARQARLVMEVTLAADLSVARNEAVSLGAPAPRQPVDQG
jgi:predicted dehydrogenase